MIKISIIVPCYNVELYIQECMESILSQSIYEIEIILIDDGSTDRTLEILEAYQEKCANVKILKQANQGSGIARNQGIRVAIGEYIAFMDADDFYPSPNTLERVYDTAKETGAIICGGSACNYRNGVYTNRGLDKGHIFSEDGWISKCDFPTSGGYWRFIYKRDFIQSKQIFFPQYLRFQDPPFFLEAIANAGEVYCMKEVTYIHRKEHKQTHFVQEKAIDYARGIRDCLVISRREGMNAACLQLLSILHGGPSACMYLFANTCTEMESIIHQINEVIRDVSKDKTNVPVLKEGEELVNYLNDVQEEKGRLLEGLMQEKSVLVFGAGVMGKRVRAFLDRNGVIIEAFVVSDVTKNAAVVDGLQVRCIDDYIDARNDCVVIIATYPVLQNEIKEILRNKGFEKIYPLSQEKLYLFEGQVVI